MCLLEEFESGGPLGKCRCNREMSQETSSDIPRWLRGPSQFYKELTHLWSPPLKSELFFINSSNSPTVTLYPTHYRFTLSRPHSLTVYNTQFLVMSPLHTSLLSELRFHSGSEEEIP